MFSPIKIKRTKASALLLTIFIPVFAMFRKGFVETDRTGGDDDITISEGYEKVCLHFYVLSLKFRVRSDQAMNYVNENGGDRPRMLLSFYKGWYQVFDSGVI